MSVSLRLMDRQRILTPVRPWHAEQPGRRDYRRRVPQGFEAI